jgi:hypothetical protein
MGIPAAERPALNRTPTAKIITLDNLTTTTMPPPLLQRYIFNPSCIRPSRLISLSLPSPQQIRNLTLKRIKAKTVFVQLTKNVPKLGVRGSHSPPNAVN